MNTNLRYPIVLLALVSLLAACGENAIEASFEEYIDRTETFRGVPDVDQPDIVGEFVDITGEYLWNIYLAPIGDVNLEMRTTFLTWEPNEDNTEAAVTGEFRIADAPVDSVPLAEFEATMDQFGRMSIRVANCQDTNDFSTCEPIFVSPELSPIEDTAVSTLFLLDVFVVSRQEMCGLIATIDAEGNSVTDQSIVVEPIMLPLAGTTFGARRYGDDGEIPVNVPQVCPFDAGGGEDAGMDTGMDAGMDAGGDVDTDGGLMPPDDELTGGTRSDVTGRFWMAAAIGGGTLALDLLIDALYFESGELASIDGSLRTPEQEAGTPAIAQFSSVVDENGVFEVIVPGLVADTSLGEVNADIALKAIIIDEDTFCGVASGEVYSPLPINLEGSTFGAVRIPSGTIDEPMTTLDRCPE